MALLKNVTLILNQKMSLTLLYFLMFLKISLNVLKKGFFAIFIAKFPKWQMIEMRW